MADPFIIADHAQGGSRVELRDHDLPFGRPRKGTAFDIGGPVEHDTIYLHGRSQPIIHVAQARFHPVVIKGHLRDRYTATDGHALAQMAAIEQLRLNARLLDLTWGKLKWTAFLEDAKFGVEGPNDLVYEIRFKVVQGPSPRTTPKTSQTQTAPADLTAQVRAILAARRAQIVATLLSRTALSAFEGSFDQADGALDTVEQAAAAFEVAVPPPRAEGRQLIGVSENAKTQLAALQARVSGAVASDVLVSQAAEHVTAFWSAQFGTASDLAVARDALWSLQLTARQALNQAAQLYQVGPNDTLESIAAAQLGSAGRVNELGLRPQDLVVGRVIRIPEA